MSDAPRVTFADAVMFEGLPDTVRNLSMSMETAYARLWGGISSSFECRVFSESATMFESFEFT